MSIDILHTSSDSFQACGGYIALKDRDKVECFLKQSLNGAILLKGCQGPAASEGKHRPLSSTCISGRLTLTYCLYNGIPQLYSDITSCRQSKKWYDPWKTTTGIDGSVLAIVTAGGNMLRWTTKTKVNWVNMSCTLTCLPSLGCICTAGPAAPSVLCSKLVRDKPHVMWHEILPYKRWTLTFSYKLSFFVFFTNSVSGYINIFYYFFI